MASARGSERPANDWYSKEEICRFQGIAKNTFDKSYRGIIPPSAMKKIGIRMWYHGPTYYEAAVAKAVANAAPASTPDGDPLLAGGDSPNLEEYRKHKARIAKVDADEREKLVVRVDVIEPLLLDSMFGIRRSLEITEREFGREAVIPTVEAIDAAIGTIKKRFEHDGDDRTTDDPPADGDETGAAADHERVRGR